MLRQIQHFLQKRAKASLTYGSFNLLISFGLLSESVAANPQGYYLAEEQLPNTVSQAENCLTREQDYKKEFRKFQGRATAQWQQAHKKHSEGVKLYDQGTAEAKTRAIKEIEEAIQIWRQMGDRSYEAIALGRLSMIYTSLNENQKALDYDNQVLSLRQASGDCSSEAATLVSIGQTYNKLGEPQKAIGLYNQALFLFRTLEKPSEQTSTLLHLGSLYSFLGDTQKAIAYFNQALEILPAVKDSWKNFWEAQVVTGLGNAYISLGEVQKALDFLEEKLSRFRAEKNLAGEGKTLELIGEVYTRSGRYREALDIYNKALVIWRSDERANRLLNLEANTLLSIGKIYGHLGDEQKASESYEQALKQFRATGDSLGEANALHAFGMVYGLFGEQQKQLALYYQVLKLRQANGDLSGEAFVLTSIGSIHSKLGNHQKALNHAVRALNLSREIGNLRIEIEALNQIGFAYQSAGSHQLSLCFYNQVLVLQRDVKDTSGESDTVSKIGLFYISLGKMQNALKFLEESLSHFKSEKNRFGEAKTLEAIGQVYSSTGQDRQALDFYEQALAIWRLDKRANKLLNLEAFVLAQMGSAYTSLGEKQKALELYSQALSQSRASGSRIREAYTLGRIGRAHEIFGEKQKALDSYKQALDIQQASGDLQGELTTLSMVSGVHSNLGEFQEALYLLNRTLTLRRTVKDRPGEANTLRAISSVYKLLGEYRLSLDSYNRALEIWRALESQNGEAQTLADIANVNRLIGEYEEALKSSKQLRELYRNLGNRLEEANVLSTIGRIHESMGQPEQVLESANEMLSMSRTMDSRFLEGAAFAMITRAHHLSGDYPKALESSTRALELLRLVRWGNSEANILTVVGMVHSSLGQPQQAVDAYNQELILRRSAGDRVGEADALFKLAQVERDRDNLHAARTHIEAALEIVESLRTKVASQDLRVSYLASVYKYYELHIDLLMQLHKYQPTAGYDALALEASERARARGLLELLTEAKADIRQGVAPELLKQERSLQEQLDALEKQRLELFSDKYNYVDVATGNPDRKVVQENLEKQSIALVAQYREVQSQIRATSPRYASLTQPQPLSLAQIQQQVLDEDTLLLEYSLGEKHSYLWAVTKTTITAHVLPKRSEVEAAAKGFRDVLTDPTLRNSSIKWSRAGLPLTQMLLGPVAAQLGRKRLLVVGDGLLQYVPFAALPAPSAAKVAKPGSTGSEVPLLVEHEIVSSPSASTLAVLRNEFKERKLAPKTVAVLADPVFDTDDSRIKSKASTTVTPKGSPVTSIDTLLAQRALERSADISGVKFHRLPFTSQEAQLIQKLVPASISRQAVGFAANRTTATSPELAQYRIVHFATHGLLDSVNPELSGVVFSLLDQKGGAQNGYLRLHEVFNLKLGAELVVLSACRTGLGRQVNGEGLVGLTRGFMYAGAPRVAVSLWSVNDGATARLMGKFYEAMLKKGLRPAAALRAAQLEMQKEGQVPYSWAGFVLQGEWRTGSSLSVPVSSQ